MLQPAVPAGVLRVLLELTLCAVLAAATLSPEQVQEVSQWTLMLALPSKYLAPRWHAQNTPRPGTRGSFDASIGRMSISISSFQLGNAPRSVAS